MFLSEKFTDAFSSAPNEDEDVSQPRVRPSGPGIATASVSRIEQRLSFGLAARYKLVLMQSAQAKGSLGLLKTISLYAAVVVLLVASAVWAAHNVFFVPPAPIVLGTATTLPSEIAITEESQQALIASFEQVLVQAHPDLVNEATLAGRTALINRYLQEWNSPLAEFSDIIAAQPHWKRVLAISFAESGLGKKCADNNCSGIGVEPGHPKWQTYETKGEWVKAMNRLLEKRYKDWTLKQMNGTYNYPGSSNWVAAGNQILDDLEERNIE